MVPVECPLSALVEYGSVVSSAGDMTGICRWPPGMGCGVEGMVAFLPLLMVQAAVGTEAGVCRLLQDAGDLRTENQGVIDISSCLAGPDSS
jgi:hypothetical protein